MGRREKKTHTQIKCQQFADCVNTRQSRFFDRFVIRVFRHFNYSNKIVFNVLSSESDSIVNEASNQTQKHR